MTVVAVIVILGKVAVPIYNEYIHGIHRADARAGLLQARQWLEQATQGGAPLPTHLPAALTWADDARKRYTIGFLQSAAGHGTSYTLIATRRGTQMGDRCGDFTLTHAGARDALNLEPGSKARECWGQ
jgi:type IV pilus assembly protein PilE